MLRAVLTVATLLILGSLTSCTRNADLPALVVSPADVTTVGTGGAMQVTWNEPADLPTHALGVDVAWRYADEEAWIMLERVPLRVREATIDDLESFRPIVVRAAFATRTTLGPWSDASGQTTASAPPAPVAMSALPEPGAAFAIADPPIPLAPCVIDGVWAVDLASQGEEGTGICAPSQVRSADNLDWTLSITPYSFPNSEPTDLGQPLPIDPVTRTLQVLSDGALDLSMTDLRPGSSLEVWDAPNGGWVDDCNTNDVGLASCRIDMRTLPAPPGGGIETAVTLRGIRSDGTPTETRVGMERLAPAGTPQVLGITASPTSLDLTVGQTTTIDVTVRTLDGADDAFNWTHDVDGQPPLVAEEDGRVTALRGGTWTLVASADADPTRTVTIPITIREVLDVTITEPPADFLLAGTSRTLDATVTTLVDADETLTWTSSTPTVATVAQDGRIDAVAPGTTTIRAESAAQPGVFDEFTLRVPETGDVLWTHQFGGAGFDLATSVTTDADGHVYFGAVENSILYGTTGVSVSDAIVASLDAYGAPRWRTSSTEETDTSVFVEHAPSDLLVLRDGRLVAAYNFGLFPLFQNLLIPYLQPFTLDGRAGSLTSPGPSISANTFVHALAERSNGQIASVGSSFFVNPTGVIWSTDIPSNTDTYATWFVSAGDAHVELNGVVALANGGAFVAGDVEPDTGGPKALGVRLDANGAWTDSDAWTVPSTYSTTDIDHTALDVAMLSDGSYVIVGDMDRPTVSGVEAWVAHVDPDTLETRNFWFLAGEGAVARAVAVGPDDTVYVAGTTQQPIHFGSSIDGSAGFVRTIRVDDGAFVADDPSDTSHTWVIDMPGDDSVVDVVVAPSGAILVAGFTHGALGSEAKGSADGFLRAFAP